MGSRTGENRPFTETDRIVLELFASCYERDTGTVWQERATAVRSLLAARVRAEEALRQIRDDTSDLIRARQIARTALAAVGDNTPPERIGDEANPTVHGGRVIGNEANPTVGDNTP